MKMLNTNWNKMTQEKGEQQQQQPQRQQSSHVFVRCAWIKWHTCETYKTTQRYLYNTFSYRHLRFTRRINDTFICINKWINTQRARTHTHTCTSIIWASFCTSISHTVSCHQIDITTAQMLISIVHCSAFVVAACVRVRTTVDAWNQNSGHGYMDYDKKSHIVIDTLSFAL